MGFDFPGKEWVTTYIPLASSIALALYVVWDARRPKVGLVNPDIQKDQQKVVHSIDVEDIGEKLSICRCWRSKTFPLCDGVHKVHNRETGDNVGPLRLKRRDVA
ncbi:hypothetical protein EGW08_022600 [Elysia chlorotica]|uniref:Iron-binding zinc finger CDGSH type domain-containing protein n=1 Tax=Elysia chlorotica TaxID=188477 RepID=A0A433SKI9_ELYCH|nr:hypothetical protein EGW08_022600 [Elysia chlorotica]